MSAVNVLRDRWSALALREQRLVAVAIALVAAALLWWTALAPALATLHNAKAQHPVLDAQLQNMLALKAQAAVLQAQVRPATDDARRLLEGSVKQAFGATASVQVTLDRATVVLKNAPSGALANWLVDLRNNARLLPSEVRLNRPLPAPSANAASPPASPDLWDGSIVVNLPGR